MITKATYIERRGASLRALDMEIARLMDYADEATGEVTNKFYAVSNCLQTTRDKAAKKLRDLHAVSDMTWKDAATGVEDAWKELRNAVLAAISVTYCEVISYHDVSPRPSEPHALEGPHQTYRARRIALRRACY